MKAIRVALSAVATLALAGCASLQVRTDYDSQASFGELRTYTWLDRDADAGGDPALNSPLLEKRIRSAVDSALATRGYQKVTSGSPDFRVGSRVLVAHKATVDRSSGYGGSYGYGYPYSSHGRFGHSRFGRRRFGHFGYGTSYGSTRVREYVQGTLILDIFDARTNELIWRGWAEDALDDNPKPEKVQMYVSEAVGKILERFPLAVSGSGRLVT